MLPGSRKISCSYIVSSSDYKLVSILALLGPEVSSVAERWVDVKLTMRYRSGASLALVAFAAAAPALAPFPMVALTLAGIRR